ncbi:MAG: hypothetical protein AAGF32_04775, partial [Pseudomonadota bacterium]
MGAENTGSPRGLIRRTDWLLWSSIVIVGLAYAWYLVGPLFVTVGPEHTHSPLQHFTMGVAEFVHLMW